MNNNTLTARLQARARACVPSGSGARRPDLLARDSLGYDGQDFRPLLGHGDGVLDVRGGAAVERDDRPAVLERLGFVRAQVNHGLDGEDVARTDFDARARLSVVRDLRVFVHFSADSVAHVIAPDAVPFGLCQRLHGPANVAQVLARPGLCNRAPEALFGDADERQPVLAHAAYGRGGGRVADVAAERDAA